VLKKAGIVVATAAAGLLAVSPLAFAGDHGGYGWDHEDGDRQTNRVDSSGGENDQVGLVNVGDVDALNNANVCPSIPVAAGLGNVLGILGAGEAAAVSDVACLQDQSIEQRNRD
jgi:hypothetical protein